MIRLVINKGGRPQNVLFLPLLIQVLLESKFPSLLGIWGENDTLQVGQPGWEHPPLTEFVFF